VQNIDVELRVVVEDGVPVSIRFGEGFPQLRPLPENAAMPRIS
jgi:hypothetical protein